MAEASQVDREADAEEHYDDQFVGTTSCSDLRISKTADDSLLHILVDRMCHEWMALGYCLGLTDPELNAIAKNGGGDQQRCCLEALNRWVAKYGKEATWEQLAMIVSKTGYKDVSEKLMEKKGDFNKNLKMYYQDPVYVDARPVQTSFKDTLDMSGEAQLINTHMLYHKHETTIGLSNALQGGSNGKHGVVSTDFESDTELRALKEQIKYQEKRKEMLHLRRYLWELTDKNDREEQKQKEENIMSVKVIEKKSHDSGIESRALLSHTSSAANDCSLARAEDRVPMNATIEKKQSEHSTSDEATCQTTSDGQMASTMQMSNVPFVHGSANIIITTGSGCTINTNVPPANTAGKGDIKEPPDTRK